MAFHPDWIVPDWPAPASVRAVFTTRAGGVSDAPWDTLNLGSHVGDDTAAVEANRERLRQAIGARPVFLEQVHGTHIVDLDVPERAAAGSAVPDADGCTSATAGQACTIMVADCLPVLFTDRAGHRVAAAHAGWRGLAGGVLEATIDGFRALAPVGSALNAIELIAWIGPAIGPFAFEVGDEVRQAFVARDAGAADAFRAGPRPGKWWADLPALARRRLAAAGVTAVYGNDGSAGWCTAANPSRFFSHRRDAARLGSNGRMAACVWKV